MKAQLLFIFTILVCTLAQDCNNPLLRIYGLTGLAAPINGSGLPYCNNLKNGQTCCSVQTIQNFQTQMDQLTDRIQNLTVRRDLFMAKVRQDYAESYQNLSKTLEGYSEEIDIILVVNTTLGNEIKRQIGILSDVANGLANIDDEFQQALREYQKDRVNCFTTVLQVQGAAWCLACDPNYANRGVKSNGEITYSNVLCQTISDACYPFLEEAIQFTPLFRANQTYQRLQNIKNYLDKIASIAGFTNVSIGGDIGTPANPTQQIVTIPQNCNEDECQWQCLNILPGGKVNESLLANGAGQLNASSLNLPPINATVSSQLNSRRLQGNSVWTPAYNESGLTILIVPDPGGINNMTSEEIEAAATAAEEGMEIGASILTSYLLALTILGLAIVMV